MAETENLSKFVLALVIISVTLIVAIMITSSLQTSFRVTDTTGTVVNETITPTTAGVNLASSSLLDGSCGTITAVYNTTHSVITAGNYTQTGCLLQNKTTNVWGVWKVSYPYTYTAETNASVSASEITDSFSDGTPWITIIVVVGFAVIVLGFLTKGFGKVETTATY